MKTKTQSTKEIGEESLESVFKDGLTDIYWTQKYLSKTFEKLAKAAHNPELKSLFEEHVNDTSLEVGRIEKCLEILELKIGTKTTIAIEGLAATVDNVIASYSESNVRDAALIAAAQKIEHYGISSYGTLRTMATVLGRVQCAELLEENKDEEAETDEKLTRLALTINQASIEA